MLIQTLPHVILRVDRPYGLDLAVGSTRADRLQSVLAEGDRAAALGVAAHSPT